MNRYNTILIFIEGGIVQSIRSVKPVNTIIIDYDCNGIDKEDIIKDKNGNDCFIYDGPISTPKKENIQETIQYYLNILDC